MAAKDRTDWTDVPDTDKHAVPIDWKAARNGGRCILVTNGRIRRAMVSGYFQVAEVLKPASTYAGRQRIQVECYWYGKKPKTTWMNLTVEDGGCKDVKHYTGAVICDIGRKTK